MADISKIEGYDIKDATARSSISSLETTVATKANFADVEQELTDLTETFNTALATKQDNLVSGTNIKTINGSDVLGSGDLTIEALPSGGVKNNLLYKKSATDGDVGWTSITTDNLLTQDNIVNNLTSSSTTNALSANQGKVLESEISAVRGGTMVIDGTTVTFTITES